MKKILIILLCLPIIGFGQESLKKDAGFGKFFSIKLKHFLMEVETLVDLSLIEDCNFNKKKDTLYFNIVSKLENKKIKISQNTLKDLKIEIAYTTNYFFSWDDGKTRQYPIYTSKYRPIKKINDSTFTTPNYTSEERSFSNITLEELTLIMKKEGLEYPFKHTRLNDLMNIDIGSYNIKITAKDKYNNTFSKILIFNLIYGC